MLIGADDFGDSVGSDCLPAIRVQKIDGVPSDTEMATAKEGKGKKVILKSDTTAAETTSGEKKGSGVTVATIRVRVSAVDTPREIDSGSEDVAEQSCNSMEGAEVQQTTTADSEGARQEMEGRQVAASESSNPSETQPDPLLWTEPKPADILLQEAPSGGGAAVLAPSVNECVSDKPMMASQVSLVGGDGGMDDRDPAGPPQVNSEPAADGSLTGASAVRGVCNWPWMQCCRRRARPRGS